MVDGPRREHVAVWCGHVLLNRTRWALREHDGLDVIGGRAQRSGKRGFLGMGYRAAEKAFEGPALLVGLHGGERVARIERRVPKDEVRNAVVLLRARLQDDLDTTPPRARVFGRVGILVDLDLLNGRSRDT